MERITNIAEDGSDSSSLPSSAPNYRGGYPSNRDNDGGGASGGAVGGGAGGAGGGNVGGSIRSTSPGDNSGTGSSGGQVGSTNRSSFDVANMTIRKSPLSNPTQFLNALGGLKENPEAIEKHGKTLLQGRIARELKDEKDRNNTLLITGYPIESNGKTRYGIATYTTNNHPLDRFNPISGTVSTYDENEPYPEKRWKEDRAGTFFARMGGPEKVLAQVKENSELQLKAPTVANAISREMDKMDLAHRDYTITFTHNTQVPDGVLGGGPGSAGALKYKQVTHSETMNLSEFLLNRNHYRGLELKGLQRNDRMNGSVTTEEDGRKILRYINDGRLDLQSTQTEMMNEFYEDPNTLQRLRKNYQNYPVYEAEKARQLGLGRVTDDHIDMIRRAQEPGGNVTRSLLSLRSVSGADAADLVLYRDGTGRSVLQGFQRSGFSGHSTQAFNSEEELNVWLRQANSQNMLKPYFNQWSRQDGVFNNGVDTEIRKVQGIDDFTLRRFTSNENEELTSAMIARRRTADKYNGDALIYSNAEWNTTLATEIAKPVIMLGTLAAAPFTGGGSLVAGGLVQSIPYGIQAFTSDSARERRSNLFGFGASLATAGLPLVGKAVRGAGNALSSVAARGGARLSHYSRTLSQSPELMPLLLSANKFKVKVM
ncbi:hypothetical protein CS022_06010 [Veronia nyctiphanis]|uniref:Uncharacterized protein n=1 Tax=Veronia nyctiphanis TaxID=1278244 RepID=A0A4V1LT70_9GAMM|nr:hypothetical protein [Veronia nyctiphanis]RXJ74168.1 hypothetical protein CS022_06010 [Veronia nyctiphanis]